MEGQLDSRNSSPRPTRALIEHVQAIRFEQLPEDVVTVARHGIRDWMAVGLAGSTEPVAQAVKQDVLDRGSNAQASVFGSEERVSAHDAALCNGTAAHALDFDDVLESMLGHPTAPILSAAFAVGEKIKASGARVLAAYVAGVEAASLLGRMVEPGHHELGWHTTGTIGTFGATAAAADLLELTTTQGENAFGLAGAQAAGLKAGFGTMAKPLHSGRAAANGVLAASLAKRGVTGAENVIETTRGFAELTTTTMDFSVLDATRSSDAYEIQDLLFKWHASCYLTHSLIEGLIQMRPALRRQTKNIARIVVYAAPVHLTTCALDTFNTDLEGKFSMRYLAALALVAGAADEAHFAAEWRQHPEILRLADMVHIRRDESTEQMASPVEVHTTDGQVHRACVNVGEPSRNSDELGAQEKKLNAKYRALLDPVLSKATSAALSAQIEDFVHLKDISSVFDRTFHTESTVPNIRRPAI